MLLISLPIFSGNYESLNAVLLDSGENTVTIHDLGPGNSDYVKHLPTPSGSNRLRFAISPIVVPPDSGTTWTPCSSPCTINVHRDWGQQVYWTQTTNSGGTPIGVMSSASSSYLANACGGVNTLPMVEPSPTTTSPFPLPLELIGQDCYTIPVQFPLVNLTGHTLTSLRLYIRCYNCGYNNTTRPDGKIEFQFNGTGSWIVLTNANATRTDESGILTGNRSPTAGNNPVPPTGMGAFSQVLGLTVAIPNGTISSGDTNVTIRFRFRGTEGIGSGARILALNIIEANKTCTTFSISSNVATGACTANGYSSGDTVLIQNGPGMYMRFSGLRTLTGVATNSFTFAPCGTNTAGCTSPNITAGDALSMPPTQTTPVDQYNTNVPPVMYAARCLIAKSSFTDTDPLTWIAPASGDATRGANYFKWGNSTGTTGQHDQLVNPNAPYTSNVLHNATCGGPMGCHPSNGSDLKTFNYSNWSIKQRTIFHGLSEQAGDDIAAYIRGLSIPATVKGRPYNPVMQPGPGLSGATWWKANSSLTSIQVSGTAANITVNAIPASIVVGSVMTISGATVDTDLNTVCQVTAVGTTNFFCTVSNVSNATYTESTLMVGNPTDFFSGCGYDCLTLDGYASGREYLMPNGSDTSANKLLWNQRAEVRDIPIQWQLATWDRWLPVCHPADCFPSAGFLSSGAYTTYRDNIDNMTPNNFASFQSHDYGRMYNGFKDFAFSSLGDPISPAFVPTQYRPSDWSTRWYSVFQFALKALWEVAIEKQTFQFDGLRIKAEHGGNEYPSPDWPIANGIADQTTFEAGIHKIHLDGNNFGALVNNNYGDGAGIMDGSNSIFDVGSNAWYVTQLIIGAGNGWGKVQVPVDMSYLQTFLANVGGSYRPGGNTTIFYEIFAMQASALKGDFAYHAGTGEEGVSWLGSWYDFGTSFSNTIAWFTNAQKAEMANTFLDILLSVTGAQTHTAWESTFNNLGWTVVNVPAGGSAGNNTAADKTAYYLTLFTVWGAGSAKLDALETWAESIQIAGWQSHNWAADRTAGTDHNPCYEGSPATSLFWAKWWDCSNMH